MWTQWYKLFFLFVFFSSLLYNYAFRLGLPVPHTSNSSTPWTWATFLTNRLELSISSPPWSWSSASQGHCLQADPAAGTRACTWRSSVWQNAPRERPVHPETRTTSRYPTVGRRSARQWAVHTKTGPWAWTGAWLPTQARQRLHTRRTL